MRAFDEEEITLAGIYARAILDLAEEERRADEVLDELDAIVGMLSSSPEAAKAFQSPLVDPAALGALVERAFRGRSSDLVTNALGVVQRKGRLQLLPAIATAYRAQLDERRGRVDVRVRSAVPLSESQRRDLAAAIARTTGKTPRLVETVDADLLGGLVVAVGDQKFDSSIRSQLERLEAGLLARASGEVLEGRGYQDHQEDGR
jgi:F-type H+-transporting ATPase subunit delta